MRVISNRPRDDIGNLTFEPLKGRLMEDSGFPLAFDPIRAKFRPTPEAQLVVSQTKGPQNAIILEKGSLILGTPVWFRV